MEIFEICQHDSMYLMDYLTSNEKIDFLWMFDIMSTYLDIQNTSENLTKCLNNI